MSIISKNFVSFYLIMFNYFLSKQNFCRAGESMADRGLLTVVVAVFRPTCEKPHYIGSETNTCITATGYHLIN